MVHITFYLCVKNRESERGKTGWIIPQVDIYDQSHRKEVRPSYGKLIWEMNMEIHEFG